MKLLHCPFFYKTSKSKFASFNNLKNGNKPQSSLTPHIVWKLPFQTKRNQAIWTCPWVNIWAIRTLSKKGDIGSTSRNIKFLSERIKVKCSNIIRTFEKSFIEWCICFAIHRVSIIPIPNEYCLHFSISYKQTNQDFLRLKFKFTFNEGCAYVLLQIANCSQ